MTPHVDLDRRRGWARARAAVACLAGVFVFACSAAGLAMIVVVAIARAWSFFGSRDFTDVPIWRLAPGGTEVMALLAVVVSFGGAFWYFWRGASAAVLHEVQAVPLDPVAGRMAIDIVEALSIGLGKLPPRMWVTEDPVPNAVSLRSSRGRDLCLTTGAMVLPRDELEALCAHELGHLWATDAHWVTSGMVALARARRFGGLVLGLGVGLFLVVAGVAKYTDLILWSTALVAIALGALGIVSRTVLRRLELAVRRHADEIADVAAVLLAKNPASLGQLCARLAIIEQRVSPVRWRSELLWFEAVEQIDPKDEAAVQLAAARTRTELVGRAVRAYSEARVPLPDAVRVLLPPP